MLKLALLNGTTELVFYGTFFFQIRLQLQQQRQRFHCLISPIVGLKLPKDNAVDNRGYFRTGGHNCRNLLKRTYTYVLVSTTIVHQSVVLQDRRQVRLLPKRVSNGFKPEGKGQQHVVHRVTLLSFRWGTILSSSSDSQIKFQCLLNIKHKTSLKINETNNSRQKKPPTR